MLEIDARCILAWHKLENSAMLSENDPGSIVKEVFAQRTHSALCVCVTVGTKQLDFIAPQTSVLQAPSVSQRLLAFSVYDY